MLRYAAAYLAAAAVFGVTDFLWLTRIGQPLYQQEIGQLLLPRPRMDAAIAFYVIYLFGLTVFGIRPGLEAGSVVKTALMAGVFGFVAYATYDLTNLATLKGFSAKVVVADLIWGVLASTVAASAGFFAARLVKP